MEAITGAGWRKSSYSGGSGQSACVEVRVWRKSSYSGGANSNCVETRSLPGVVAVRDSKDPHGPVLAIPADGWRAFTAQVKAGALIRLN